jgi:hypothetical protein
MGIESQVTETELIARQAKQIEELQDELGRLWDGINEARSVMVGIGGPLNDSRLAFTAEQRAVFHRIYAALPEESSDDD